MSKQQESYWKVIDYWKLIDDLKPGKPQSVDPPITFPTRDQALEYCKDRDRDGCYDTDVPRDPARNRFSIKETDEYGCWVA